MALPRSLSRRWRTLSATVPGLPFLLLLVVLNLGYFTWSYRHAMSQSAAVPTEIKPAAIVTITAEEGQRLSVKPKK